MWGLIGGIGFYRQLRLAGRYAPGEEIAENLNDDQLHRGVFRPGWMFAVTFRFGSNPFADGGEAEKDSEATTGKSAAPAPSTPSTAKPKGEPEKSSFEPAGGDGYRLSFTERGDLAEGSKSTLDEILKDAAGATDIFIFSHGWWNNPSVAECRYKEMIEGMRGRRPPAAQEASFKPLLIGIYWPSAVFPTEQGDCGARGVRPPTESLVEGSFDQDVQSWAAEAFPTARERPSFAGEVARVVELLGRERRGESLARAEAVELARILDSWRNAGVPQEGRRADGPEPETFSGQPAAMVDQWLTTVETSPGRGEASVLSRALNFANAFTFWTMKERAGIVGSRGLYDVVRALPRRGPQAPRIHLIGHSFGGKVVSAAVRGPEGAEPNHVDTLILLQAAFSHFAFTTVDDMKRFGVVSDRPGVYVDVVKPAAGQPSVQNVIVATFSRQDDANQRLYPLGVAIRRDFREAQRVGKYGAIGADGIQGPPVTDLVLSKDLRLSAMLRQDAAARIVNVDATDVITGHSDLAKRQVFDLIWDAVLAGRR